MRVVKRTVAAERAMRAPVIAFAGAGGGAGGEGVDGEGEQEGDEGVELAVDGDGEEAGWIAEHEERGSAEGDGVEEVWGRLHPDTHGGDVTEGWRRG